MGALLSTFSLAYGLAQLPIGPLLDRFGARLILGIGLALWSLAQLLTGFVTGMQTFVPLRALLGLGEAPFFPAAIKLVRQIFPEEQRGRATATVNVSSAIGQGLAPPLLTAMMLRFGWRSMFSLIGALGLLLAALWFPLQRRAVPESLTPHESTTIVLFRWRALFRTRTLWGLMLGFGGINYTAWFYITWLPDYLQKGRHVSVSASGWFAAISFLSGSCGMFFSGLRSDRMARAGLALPLIHRQQIVAGMLFSAACTLAATRVTSASAAVACISLALFSIHFAGTSSWGLVQAISPPGLTASVGSIQNFGSFMIASTGPLATGYLLDRTHTFAPAFLLSALVTTLGATGYLLLVRDLPLPP